jgi:hypothetical protein
MKKKPATSFSYSITGKDAENNILRSNLSRLNVGDTITLDEFGISVVIRRINLITGEIYVGSSFFLD